MAGTHTYIFNCWKTVLITGEEIKLHARRTSARWVELSWIGPGWFPRRENRFIWPSDSNVRVIRIRYTACRLSKCPFLGFGRSFSCLWILWKMLGLLLFGLLMSMWFVPWMGLFVVFMFVVWVGLLLRNVDVEILYVSVRDVIWKKLCFECFWKVLSFFGIVGFCKCAVFFLKIWNY